MSAQPNSIEDIAERLRVWAAQPGASMALAEFSSEYSRQRVLELLRNSLTVPLPEFTFASTGDTEHDVRQLVASLPEAPDPLISVHGIAAAFPKDNDRIKAIDLLNFLRESIALFKGRQIWWVTPEVARIIWNRASDWLSWFSPRLQLKEDLKEDLPRLQLQEDLESEIPVLTENRLFSISLTAARDRVNDTRERIRRADSQTPSAELWRNLAEPALADLRRAGVHKEVQEIRSEFLDLVYGEAQDAARMDRIRGDVYRLLQARAYPAAASLAGEGVELLLSGAAPGRQIETWMGVGNARWRAGDFSGAERLFLESAELSERLLREGHLEYENDLATALTNRGVSLRSLGRLEESVGSHDRAIAIRERLVKEGQLESENKLASVFINRGASLDSLGRLGEAVEAYDRAIAILERLVRKGRLELESNLAKALMNRGVSLRALGRLREAVEAHGRAIAILERLVRKGRLDLENDLATVLINLGVSLQFLELPTEAMEAHDHAIEILKALVGESQMELDNDLAKALVNRGVSLRSLGRFTDATESHSQAIEILERLVAEGRLELESDLAKALMSRSASLDSSGQLSDAVESNDRAIGILERLVEQGREELSGSLGMVYANRGIAKQKLGDPTAACEDFKQAKRAFETASRNGQQGLNTHMEKLNRLIQSAGCG